MKPNAKTQSPTRDRFALGTFVGAVVMSVLLGGAFFSLGGAHRPGRASDPIATSDRGVPQGSGAIDALPASAENDVCDVQLD